MPPLTKKAKHIELQHNNVGTVLKADGSALKDEPPIVASPATAAASAASGGAPGDQQAQAPQQATGTSWRAC